MTMQIHKTNTTIKPNIKLSSIIIKNEENKIVKEIKEDNYDSN